MGGEKPAQRLFFFSFSLLILNLQAFYFESHSHQMGLLAHTWLSGGCCSPRNVLLFISTRSEKRYRLRLQNPAFFSFSFLVLQTASDPWVVPPPCLSPSLGCAHTEGLPIHFRWVMLWDLTPVQRGKLCNSMPCDGSCNVNYTRPPAAQPLHGPAGFWRSVSHLHDLSHYVSLSH